MKILTKVNIHKSDGKIISAKKKKIIKKKLLMLKKVTRWAQ